MSEGTTSVFVHGYNTNFAEGLYRQAQLLHDYDAHSASVHFAWPSAASGQGYVYDLDKALYSRGALEATLRAMAGSQAMKINVIAHSMGAFLRRASVASGEDQGADRQDQRLEPQERGVDEAGGVDGVQDEGVEGADVRILQRVVV